MAKHGKDPKENIPAASSGKGGSRESTAFEVELMHWDGTLDVYRAESEEQLQKYLREKRDVYQAWRRL